MGFVLLPVIDARDFLPFGEAVLDTGRACFAVGFSSLSDGGRLRLLAARFFGDEAMRRLVVRMTA
jgi:hypothetical protein